MNKKKLLLRGVIALLAATLLIVFVYFSHNNQISNQASDKLAQLAAQDYSEESLKAIADQYPSTKAGKTARYKLGQWYEENKEYEKAIDAFKACPSKNNLIESERNFYLSRCYLELNQLKEALAFAQKAIDNFTGHQQKYYNNIYDIYEKLKESSATDEEQQSIAQKQLDIVETVVNHFKEDKESSIVKKMVAAKETLKHEIEN